MKQIFTALALLVISFSAYAQSNRANTDFLKFENKLTSETNFFKEYDRALGISDNVEMREISSNEDKSGMTHTRYKQIYDGVPVIGGTYILHSRAGLVLKSNGNIYPNLAIDKSNKLPVKTAEKMAINHFQVEVIGQAGNHDIKSHIVSDKLIDNANPLCIIDRVFPSKSGDMRLAYVFQLSAIKDGEPVGKKVYIDAETGELIDMFDFIIHERTPATGESNYHGTVEFDTEAHTNGFVLNDLSRGSGVFVKDIMNERMDIYDEDNHWDFGNESQNTSIDVMYATQAYYDFLKDYFDRSSIDDNDERLECHVNYPGYVNAFWNGSFTTYGSGDCDRYSPLTAIDIVGHEFTHGLTERTAGLIYRSESGALNESMSDIFGKTLEYITHPTEFNWIIGGDIVRNASVNPIRSMENPNDLGDPKHYNGVMWESTSRDRFGVHINSGVMNHWYYLLVEGGSGINEDGGSYNVQAQGFEKAINIAYSTLVNYLVNDSDYKEAFNYSLEATIDLYGLSSPEYDAVQEAWRAVGMQSATSAARFVDFRIGIDGLTGNDLTRKVFCPDELGSQTISLQNRRETILAGTQITGTVEYDNEMSQRSSFNYDFVLSEDWESFDSRDIGIISLNDPLSFNEALLDITVNISIGAAPNTVGNSEFSSLKVSFDPNVSLSFQNEVSIDAYDACDQNSVIGELEFYLTNLGCRPMAATDILVVSVVDESNNQTNTENYMLSDLFFFGDQIVYDRLLSDFNLLGSTPKGSLSVEFSLLSGTYGEIVIDTVALSSYFSAQYAYDDPIEFDTEISLDEVLVQNAWNGSHVLENEALVFEKSYYNEAESSECLPLDQYIYTLSTSSFFNEMSNLVFCVDPVIDESVTALSFELYFEEEPQVAILPESEKAYYRLVQVYQGDMELGDPIISAQDQFVQFSMPLADFDTESIRFEILAGRTKVHIDNIVLQVIESNDETSLAETLIYPNPATSFINIEIEEDGGVLKIYDALGREVLTTNNKGENHLDVSVFNSGVYFFQLDRGEKYAKERGKFIVKQ